jgi:prepilin-type N-terminal cleavage/methylation domain-containing protein
MSERREDGFSVVEVIIAMFLLAVLALAVLPLVIGATQVSVSNRDLVGATAFANAQLAPIRAAFPNDPVSPTTCSSLRSRAATDVTDPAGTGLEADIVVGTCPATSPGTGSVTVTVRDSTGEVTSIPTRIMVSLA